MRPQGNHWRVEVLDRNGRIEWPEIEAPRKEDAVHIARARGFTTSGMAVRR